MKIVIWILLLLTLLNATAKEITDPYQNINYFKLDNGLSVYLLSDEKAVNTQISLTVKVGYDLEDSENYGLSHLVEHMVFRDQRVPHHDYLDYIKEEGGTYVNGYTKRYETGYVATIESAKSYWITDIFAQMIFDKNVTDRDLSIEKGALQTEIGESHWYIKLLWSVGEFFKGISPVAEDFSRDEFSLAKLKDLPASYHAQENNQNFTLDEVMQHYRTYYYPANMTLSIAGNFSTPKMKRLIEERYGKIDSKGTLWTIKPPKNPILNHKPYRRFYEGADENAGYIGAKYILDDYRKYLILSSYTDNLAQRLQQQMRNRDGRSYSVNAYMFHDRHAGTSTVSFDGLNSEFQSNINQVKATIAADLEHLDDSTITEALNNYIQKYYASIEHDSASLMALIGTAKYLRDEHNITDRSSFEIFRSITPELFRETISKTFTPENSYSYIQRDYYFFPLEMIVISILSLILFFFVYFRLYRIDLIKEGIVYTHRDIIMQRRLSNRFIGFLVFLIVMMAASFSWEWIKYILFDALFGDPFYLLTIDVPYSYIATVADPICYMMIFVLMYRYLFSYYARIDIVQDNIYAIGSRVKAYPRDEIKEISTVAWHPRYFGKTLGSAMRFWKPLIRIDMMDGGVSYLRADRAKHLEEDLNGWLNNSDNK